jgi:hypothetical protein
MLSMRRRSCTRVRRSAHERLSERRGARPCPANPLGGDGSIIAAASHGLGRGDPCHLTRRLCKPPARATTGERGCDGQLSSPASNASWRRPLSCIKGTMIIGPRPQHAQVSRPAMGATGFGEIRPATEVAWQRTGTKVPSLRPNAAGDRAPGFTQSSHAPPDHSGGALIDI